MYLYFVIVFHQSIVTVHCIQKINDTFWKKNIAIHAISTATAYPRYLHCHGIFSLNATVYPRYLQCYVISSLYPLLPRPGCCRQVPGVKRIYFIRTPCITIIVSAAPGFPLRKGVGGGRGRQVCADAWQADNQANINNRKCRWGPRTNAMQCSRSTILTRGAWHVSTVCRSAVHVLFSLTMGSLAREPWFIGTNYAEGRRPDGDDGPTLRQFPPTYFLNRIRFWGLLKGCVSREITGTKNDINGKVCL
jgi:hypothetical protein